MFLYRLRNASTKWPSPLRNAPSFSVHAVLHEKPFPPRLVVPETDIEESFLKGTGPGGQKINKTSSAVQLKHLPTGIVVKNQDTRSRAQNRKTARRLLGEKLEEMEKGPLSRMAIKAEREKKKKASASKKARRKYRKLDEDKAIPENDDAGDQREDEYPSEHVTDDAMRESQHEKQRPSDRHRSAPST